jgi:undecaprenyl-diphosphatase
MQTHERARGSFSLWYNDPMLEGLVLGFIQGVVEWLPISSEGLLVIAQTQFFGQESVTEAIRVALFLHLGTFAAALLYFWDEIVTLFKDTANYRKVTVAKQNKIKFYVIASVTSGVIGFVLLKVIQNLEHVFEIGASVIVIVIATLLLLTAYLQLRKKSYSYRGEGESNVVDALTTGAVQGFAALPGVSRSGSTTSILLLQRFHESDALKMSFILSLPIVLVGNILLNIDAVFFTVESLAAFLASFVFGYLTIAGLLRLAQKMNFGWFVFIFSMLLYASLFL